MSANARKILVTCALPYANGPIHLGHMLEQIQADIWVRFQRMQNNEVYFVCADDAHGTPIMLKADQMNISPEELVAKMQQLHMADSEGFYISFDHYHSTHSAENLELVREIYDKLNRNGFIKKRTISQLYDPLKNMFLPDRFVKGICPHCKAENQYGDNCEVCSSTYNAVELINPHSVISGAEPVIKDSEHFFFDLPNFESMLKQWIASGSLQQEVANKMKEWFDTGLQQWDISRDAPYFGFEIPDAPNKYFYVWLDAPIGYMASFKHLCDKNRAINFDDFWQKDADSELYHFIGKDIMYFHSLFWPAMLEGANLRKPTNIFAHGYVTVNGEKMSKSRGTFIQAKTYLKHLDPEYLRYYYAAKLSHRIDDIDLNLDDFMQRVNTDLVNKLVNLASRNANFIHKRFAGTLADKLEDVELFNQFTNKIELIGSYYENREYNKAIREIMALADKANKYIDDKAPWAIAKQAEKEVELHQVCSMGIQLFRILIGYLKPILPTLAEKSEKFLNTEINWNNLNQPLLNHRIEPYKALFLRLDKKQIELMVNESKQENNQAVHSVTPQEHSDKTGNMDIEPISATITIDDFAKIDMRVAKVLDCQKVAGSSKLLKFNLDLGIEQRTVFSGIANYYLEPEKLVGRLVIVVANLAPRKMAKFGTSEGMIVSAVDQQSLFLLDVDSKAKIGMRIS